MILAILNKYKIIFGNLINSLNIKFENIPNLINKRLYIIIFIFKNNLTRFKLNKKILVKL